MQEHMPQLFATLYVNYSFSAFIVAIFCLLGCPLKMCVPTFCQFISMQYLGINFLIPKHGINSSYFMQEGLGSLSSEAGVGNLSGE